MSRSFPDTVWDELSRHDGARRHFVEHPSRDFVHPASIDDCEAVLAQLPADLTRGVRAIVLRVPRPDEAWRGVEAWRRGGVIALLAMPATLTMTWHDGITDGMRRHYRAWCDRWTHDPPAATLHWEFEELRRYYQYHLLLHELGHVNDPQRRSAARREAFAEDFALTWARRLGVLADPPSRD